VRERHIKVLGAAQSATNTDQYGLPLTLGGSLPRDIQSTEDLLLNRDAIGVFGQELSLMGLPASIKLCLTLKRKAAAFVPRGLLAFVQLHDSGLRLAGILILQDCRADGGAEVADASDGRGLDSRHRLGGLLVDLCLAADADQDGNGLLREDDLVGNHLPIAFQQLVCLLTEVVRYVETLGFNIPTGTTVVIFERCHAERRDIERCPLWSWPPNLACNTAGFVKAANLCRSVGLTAFDVLGMPSQGSMLLALTPDLVMIRLFFHFQDRRYYVLNRLSLNNRSGLLVLGFHCHQHWSHLVHSQ